MNMTYLKPEVEILDIMTEEMIAASGPLENGVDLSSVGETEATSGNLSRELDEFIDWD
jgi:hypothetical protein